MRYSAAVVGPEQLFVVTTRSRLKGWWRFPQMMWGTLKVRRQLREDGQVEVGPWKGLSMGQPEPAYERPALDPAKAAALRNALRRLRRLAERDENLLRAVVGVGTPEEVYLLALWSTRAGAERLLASPGFARLARRFPELWAKQWLPENEFGHWDGVRLRQTRDRYSIAVPKVAMDVANPHS